MTDLKTTLWQRLNDQRAGMLGIDGTGMHMQPMTPYAEPDSNAVWFISAAESDLTRAAGGKTAHFAFQSPDERFYACISGTIRKSDDRGKLKELWGTIPEAFFEGHGPEEADAVLLQMTPDEAAVWTSETGRLEFAAEIARAAASDSARPDLGRHDVIALP